MTGLNTTRTAFPHRAACMTLPLWPSTVTSPISSTSTQSSNGCAPTSITSLRTPPKLTWLAAPTEPGGPTARCSRTWRSGTSSCVGSCRWSGCSVGYPNASAASSPRHSTPPPRRSTTSTTSAGSLVRLRTDLVLCRIVGLTVWSGRPGGRMSARISSMTVHSLSRIVSSLPAARQRATTGPAVAETDPTNSLPT